jgi:hypothetical protein
MIRVDHIIIKNIITLVLINLTFIYKARVKANQLLIRKDQLTIKQINILLTVKIRQPSHEFTFGVGISFIPYPLVLTPVV